MKMRTLTIASVATVTMSAGFAMGETLTIDLAGILSYDSYGSAGNVVLNFSELAGATITGVAWENVVGNGDDSGATWGNEMNMAFEGILNVQFFPGEGDTTAGGIWGPAEGSFATSLDVGDDGLEVEFYEGYDDIAGAADAHYESGTVTIEYAIPAPGALALLGLAGIAGRRRRRA